LRKWGHFPDQQKYIEKEVLGSKKNFSDKKCDKLHFFGDKMQFTHTRMPRSSKNIISYTHRRYRPNPFDFRLNN